MNLEASRKFNHLFNQSIYVGLIAHWFHEIFYNGADEK